jgi:hypothetical protein
MKLVIQTMLFLAGIKAIFIGPEARKEIRLKQILQFTNLHFEDLIKISLQDYFKFEDKPIVKLSQNCTEGITYEFTNPRRTTHNHIITINASKIAKKSSEKIAKFWCKIEIIDNLNPKNSAHQILQGQVLDIFDHNLMIKNVTTPIEYLNGGKKRLPFSYENTYPKDAELDSSSLETNGILTKSRPTQNEDQYLKIDDVMPLEILNSFLLKKKYLVLLVKEHLLLRDRKLLVIKIDFENGMSVVFKETYVDPNHPCYESSIIPFDDSSMMMFCKNNQMFNLTLVEKNEKISFASEFIILNGSIKKWKKADVLQSFPV